MKVKECVRHTVECRSPTERESHFLIFTMTRSLSFKGKASGPLMNNSISQNGRSAVALIDQESLVYNRVRRKRYG